MGTITEVYDYMRVLYARVGTLYCTESNEEVKKYTPPEIVRSVLEHKEKSKVFVLAKIMDGQSSDLEFQIKKFLSLGFSRVRINGEIRMIDDEIKLEKSKKHSLELIVDRILLKEGVEKRLTDSVEHALKLGDGIITILIDDNEIIFSEKNMALRVE